MVDQLAITAEVAFPDASQLITEDDTPVDNFAAEKQQRLLTSCLYSNLKEQPFIAAANVGVYHIFSLQLSETPLRLFELRGMHYTEMAEPWLEQGNLGLTTWKRKFAEREDTWLRWRNAAGAILLTGDEQAEQARHRAEQAEQRADRLAEFLRSQGINPINRRSKVSHCDANSAG